MRWFGIALLALLLVAITGCDATPSPANDLLAGSTWEYRLNDGEWAPGELTVPANFRGAISARTTFSVTAAQLDEMACVQIDQLTNDRIRLMDVNYLLNGQMVVPPVMERGVFLDTIYGVRTDFLHVGDNELAFTISAGNGPEPKPFWTVEMNLLAMLPRHIDIRTGPIVSAFDENGVWITCRTNIPAEVTLEGNWGGDDFEIAATSSDDGLNHKLYVPREGDELAYFLTATSDGSTLALAADLMPADGADATFTPIALSADGTSFDPYRITLWSEGEPLRFVVTGDTQRNPEAWGAIANAVAAENPALVASVGDMNEHGQCDWRWDPELFTPGAAMFATTPFYPSIGNHEVNYNSHVGNRDADCVLLDDFFVMPANHMRRSWAQQLGPVLIVSFEGHRDFSPGTALHDWLKTTLAEAGEDVEYIFLVNHYPAWSTSGYMNLTADGGEPRWYVDAKQMQDVIVPLALEYGATAIVVGHDHFYQRSELPGGLTQVLTGTSGSGGGQQGHVPAGANPYAVVGKGGYHYCVFDVTDDGCVMTVKNIDGEVIDTRTWAPRDLAAAE